MINQDTGRSLDKEVKRETKKLSRSFLKQELAEMRSVMSSSKLKL